MPDLRLVRSRMGGKKWLHCHVDNDIIAWIQQVVYGFYLFVVRLIQSPNYIFTAPLVSPAINVRIEKIKSITSGNEAIIDAAIA